MVRVEVIDGRLGKRFAFVINGHSNSRIELGAHTGFGIQHVGFGFEAFYPDESRKLIDEEHCIEVVADGAA